MERKPQAYANHGKFDPLYHFFLVPVLLLMLVGSIWAVLSRQDWPALRYFVFTLWLVFLLYRVRTYPLKVQDRIIRLEERLRLATLLPDRLRPRISELTEQQIIALRFASDDELPALAERALNEKLGLKEIKQAVRSWRPDYWRV